MNVSDLRRAHEFLRSQLLYPLVLPTGLCAVLIVGRVVLSNTHNYAFLVWNLFLAWVPYGAAVWTARALRAHPGRRRKLILPATLWILFLPNAAYIMTDFNHIQKWQPFPLQYDIVMIFAFALTGLLLWVASVDLIAGLVRAARGRFAGWATVIGSAVLSGVGVYVGRFLRWNSWYVLTRPGYLARSAIDELSDWPGQTHALGHVAVFATVMFLCHLTFVALRAQGRDSYAPGAGGFPVGPLDAVGKAKG
jgi:uncharacterized membrane protein